MTTGPWRVHQAPLDVTVYPTSNPRRWRIVLEGAGHPWERYVWGSNRRARMVAVKWLHIHERLARVAFLRTQDETA